MLLLGTDHGPEPVFIGGEVASLASALRSTSIALPTPVLSPQLFDGDDEQVLVIGEHTMILLADGESKTDPAFAAAARNLAGTHVGASGDLADEPVAVQYIGNSTVITTSRAVASLARLQVARAQRLARSRASQFAGSAHYMGSKRELASFLVESVFNVMPEQATVLDLMCGSGAAARAFAEFWPTLASDAQAFCRTLAVAQGGGFTTDQAAAVLADVLPRARENAAALGERLAPLVGHEDRILHSDIGEDLLRDYVNFEALAPVYTSDSADGATYENWSPRREVESRQVNPKLFPYCLFAAYFANVYFGLRQCIEIDSLRFGIEAVSDRRTRLLALGALVAAVSATGTTYAGHFAQPKRLDRHSLASIVERRAQSVTHEFSVRLLNLAAESERCPHAITEVPGPWRTALMEATQLLGGAPVMVYLDAPYKREEYSRYYHVLETLVTYGYPSALLKGKMPDKQRGERFRSEFFTRSKASMEQALADVIREIVGRGWCCAWSYSDTGDAYVPSVIDTVRAATGCSSRCNCTPYVHRSQGGRDTKKVVEMLVTFVPARWPG